MASATITSFIVISQNINVLFKIRIHNFSGLKVALKIFTVFQISNYFSNLTITSCLLSTIIKILNFLFAHYYLVMKSCTNFNFDFIPYSNCEASLIPRAPVVLHRTSTPLQIPVSRIVDLSVSHSAFRFQQCAERSGLSRLFIRCYKIVYNYLLYLDAFEVVLCILCNVRVLANR